MFDFSITDMGIQQLWKTLREDGGILYSTKYEQCLVLEYDSFSFLFQVKSQSHFKSVESC